MNPDEITEMIIGKVTILRFPQADGLYILPGSSTMLIEILQRVGIDSGWLGLYSIPAFGEREDTEWHDFELVPVYLNMDNLTFMEPIPFARCGSWEQEMIMKFAQLTFQHLEKIYEGLTYEHKAE